MNVEIASRRVDWDDEKAATNLKKHGIKFEDAARIFLDDNRLDLRYYLWCTRSEEPQQD